MQCPNCEFYNMPGSADCGRCGSTLRANALTIDVNPPRAAASSKFWRRLFPGRVAYRLRDEVRQLRRDVGRSVDRVGFSRPTTGALWRMIVPGWSLMHVGERRSGGAFFGAWALLVFLSFVFFGSVIGNVCLGLAFGVHVGSCLAVFRRGGQSSVSARIWMTVMTAAALVIVLYLPAAYLVSRVATPIWLNYAAAPFAVGDVLILNPRAFVNSAPQPGDIVLYQQGYRILALPGTGIQYAIEEGAIVDRVLASPGDHVRWKNGRLLVNGNESPHRPLNVERIPDGLEWTIPANNFLILPTASVALNAQIMQEAWQAMGLVQAENIIGRIYFRTQPLSRWGRIR